ncbi:MAG: Glu-tRNA(Gln) amidotransferase subunit GatE [Bacteroidota bacterium]|nr:Glu-tRNA(Gln) amidotransferase subunit GatE [Bacteroidota bacterium]
MHEFKFKPFSEMTESDYATVGFKSGLEIHQQLLTEKKLFCRCPAGRYSDKYDAEILRHMRPTLSELGEYDGTALMEFKTKKEIIYRIKRETVCTYEMDDTPPFQIDDHALDSALAIGMLYGCTMVDEIHIARKQYLDGSIPTGFQRTAIVGVDGKIPYKNREIKIIQLSIEEGSCREVSDIGHRRVYITDRLGMPLIETVTGPDMRTPNEVAEVAQICRRLVRSTGRVRTGIGAGREDVNVSVTGGTRIEIKGVPRIVSIPLLTYNEAMRQWNLLRLREELKRRGITEKSFKSKTENVTKILRKTRYQPIQNAVEQGMKINCVLLQGFKGLLRWQTQTDTYFSREISDRVRVVACLTTLPNIIHSDSSGDTIAASEWQNIKKQIGGTDDDTLVLVWGDEQDVNTGAQEIVIRAKEATIGIPSETRQAFRDGTNGFERILPGPNRMYPDTDLPPKRIEDVRLEKLRLTLPNRIWENEKWYRKLKIPSDVIESLAASKYTKLFEMLVKDSKLNPTLVAVVLIQYQKRLKTYFPKAKQIKIEIFEEIFEAFRSGIITREGIFLAMQSFLTNGKLRFPKKIKSTELLKVINDSKKAIKKMKIQKEEKKTEILIGLIMNKVRGKVDGKLVAEKIGFPGKGKN